MQRRPRRIHRPCRGPSLQAPSRRQRPRERRDPAACADRPMQLYACGDRSTRRLGHRLGLARSAAPADPLTKRAVLAHQEVEMAALFVCELEEHLLAFGILEALGVPLEELVRATFAPDAYEQRLGIVNAVA